MRSKAFLAVAVCGLLSSVFADLVQLDVIYRDFANNHDGFEGAINGLTTGMVSSSLGIDGTPTLIDGKGSISDLSTFVDWYHNTSYHTGNPYTAVYNEKLDVNKTGDLLSFSDNSFFPLDAKPHDVNADHNYLFTMQLGSEFTYKGGETFNFSGDDDVWVFINDKLAMDLGGVHSVADGTIDLDAEASTLGITKGMDYSFDLFFAERHTVASNLSFQTNIQLKPTSVPEPSVVSLLGFGLFALFGLRKRFKI
jgi:fibro-slime domain-containing protein